MKRISIFILSIVFLGFQSLVAQDQQFAHVNLGNVLAEMPQVAEAEEELQELRDSLKTVYEQRIKQLEADYGAFQREVAQGTIPPVQQQQKAQEFQAEQQKIMEFEQQLSSKMEMRRQKKLAPILEQVENAIEKIAVEKGYTMVFDTSGGAMVYAEESKEISDEVKSELGIQ